MPYVDGVFVLSEWLDKSTPRRIDPAKFKELGIAGEPSDDYGKGDLPHIIPDGIRDQIKDAATFAGKKFVNRPAKCRRCGKVFERKSGNHHYCSEDCSRLDQFGERVCPVCKKVFAPKTQGTTYCSRACYIKSGASRRRK